MTEIGWVRGLACWFVVVVVVFFLFLLFVLLLLLSCGCGGGGGGAGGHSVSRSVYLCSFWPFFCCSNLCSLFFVPETWSPSERKTKGSNSHQTDYFAYN